MLTSTVPGLDKVKLTGALIPSRTVPKSTKALSAFNDEDWEEKTSADNRLKAINTNSILTVEGIDLFFLIDIVSLLKNITWKIEKSKWKIAEKQSY